jgi:acetyltransferase
LGDSLDIDLADILDYLAGDYRVRAILLYLEHIGDARKFMSAARRAARTKPVIVLKPRRFPVEPDDAVYAAAFRRAGLLRVDDSDELLQMVEVLKAAKLVHNDRLAILEQQLQHESAGHRYPVPLRRAAGAALRSHPAGTWRR